ncbi:MAG: hypothetical protein FWC20_01960 [Oscillospiraceae bacterium]|nr:hypothetical protein [Oscillospiraceae bacterium]MCL2278158.1 hypothetical protein [Oscillospiraceae bacterium]
MPLHNCPECGFEIPEGELVCFNCGFLIDEPIAPIVPENPEAVPEGEVPLEGEPLDGEAPAGEASPNTQDSPIHDAPGMSDESDTEEPLHYDGPSDESLQRGCLIAVGIIATFILVIMMIITFNVGTR